ncbi:MAG: helix-turn-helix transcriptional regulator [Victivallaceae bacterium]|nr:helix-turn-helix transcriptional regulator [Victivallaceae bacterium]
MLEFFRRDIRHTEAWLQELKHTENTLKAVLHLKNGKNKRKNMTALKRQFLKCGLKQKTLAEKLGITKAAVSLQIKTGIKMTSVAEKYGKAMNCDPRLLLEFDS